MSLNVRPAGEMDLSALAALDLSYPAGRYLEIAREGASPQLTFTLRWRTREPVTAVYAEYTPQRLARALARADLFLVAEVDSRPAGLLIVLVPSWTDAAEITDLAVDASCRGRGAGRALIQAAAEWAQGRSCRSLWVEPRSDNVPAIEFYGSLGFRLSGFNDRLYSNEDGRPGQATLYMHLELG